MVVKRVLISLVCLIVSTLMYGQVALKTNVAMDAIALPNVGAEVGLSKKLTLDVPVYYAPWKSYMWKNDDKKFMKLFMVQPEIRYWLCDKFNGHFFGLHGMGGAYHTTGVGNPPLWINSPLDEFYTDEKGEKYQLRHKGEFWGFGLSYGYQYILGRHWSIEGTIGVGYARVTDKQYECVDCGDYVGKKNHNYFGPTRAALNLIYVF